MPNNHGSSKTDCTLRVLQETAPFAPEVGIWRTAVQSNFRALQHLLEDLFALALEHPVDDLSMTA